MADKSLTLSCAQSGTSFTTKLNDALEAINTMRSGSSAPTNNLEDGVMWLDTSGADKVIKIRIGGVFHPLLDFDGSNWYAERAEEATKLATARNIALTGKVTGTASFDGTANATIATTLDTSGTWSGTATSATSAGTASTATKLATARTITLGTDLSGNVNFDGGTNVTLNASLEPNTVGDSELSAGGTLGDGKVLTGTSDTEFSWEDAAGGLERLVAATSGTGSFAAPTSGKVLVFAIGGGGSGSRHNQGGGGSAGGGAAGGKVYAASITVSGMVDWSVGAGGVGATGFNDGNAGTSTTVGTLIAGGGQGGLRSGGNNAAGGAGGTVSNTGTSLTAINGGNGGTAPGSNASGAGAAGIDWAMRTNLGAGTAGNFGSGTNPTGTGGDGILLVYALT